MIQNQATTLLPTEYGSFQMIAYSEKETNWMPHIAMIHENTNYDKPIPVRIHSECLTGDVFFSTKCECGKQLESAMNYISENGGVVIYLRQEGRNIGIINKIKAYKLQEEGKNTVEANFELGLPADGRSYEDAISILTDLGIKSIYLLTNSPDKINAFKDSTIKVEDRISLEIEKNIHSESYLEVKKSYFNHILNL